jgi:muramoyltetrapeptide carboxypeptidase
MGEIKCNPLSEGDSIALIAPARAVSQEEMEPFLQWAASKKLVVVAGKNLYQRHNQFAGTDLERATDFISAWTNPAVKAVFCARGGYGCMRWLQHVGDGIWSQGAGKILIGYSDITTLHFVLHRYGFETVHGPMAISWKNGNETLGPLDALWHCISGEGVQMRLDANEKIHAASFDGILTGGNLSMVYASLGTPEQPDTDGKILFLEDLDEYLYHIDRMMVSLDRAGLLKSLKALLIGDMLQMRDNAIPFGMTVPDIIKEHAGKYGYPIIFDVPVGHSEKNYCLKLNAYTTFDGSILKQSF